MSVSGQETDTAPYREPVRIFLCNSRSDSEFALRLAQDLTDRGFSVTLDVKDILPAEQWISALAGLILDADIVLFIVSPAALQSEVCKWELEEAKRWAKRIVSVLIQNVDREEAAGDHLASIAVSFEEPSQYGPSMTSLRRILRADGGWLRQHTQLLRQALNWNQRDRSGDYVLRGAALSEALEWREKRPSACPEPTSLQMAFIEESQRRARIENANLPDARRRRSMDPVRPLGTKIFISYRRSDTSQSAGRIFDYLRNEVPEDEIFFDVDSIPIGVDFKEYICGGLQECAVVLAVVGKGWLNEKWRRRWWRGWLPKRTEDFVETELQLALDLRVPIIPILTDGASMPSPSVLPDAIKDFSVLNATSVRSGRDFHQDMAIVKDLVESHRAKAVMTARNG